MNELAAQQDTLTALAEQAEEYFSLSPSLPTRKKSRTPLKQTSRSAANYVNCIRKLLRPTVRSRRGLHSAAFRETTKNRKRQGHEKLSYYLTAVPCIIAISQTISLTGSHISQCAEQAPHSMRSSAADCPV